MAKVTSFIYGHYTCNKRILRLFGKKESPIMLLPNRGSLESNAVDPNPGLDGVSAAKRSKRGRSGNNSKIQ